MSWPDRLSASLRRLYRRPPALSEHELQDMSVPPRSLEHDLLRRLPRPRQPAPGGLGAFAHAHRFALSAGLAAVAVAAACQVPVDYARGFGASLWCEAASADVFTSDRVRLLAEDLQQRTAAEQVAIRVHADDAAHATLRIDLWGDGLVRAGDDLLAEIDRLTALPGARCQVEPHVETVHGTLGGRLGLELFDLELLDRGSAEAARAAILGRLEARGLRGDARIEISEHDGRREVEIRIEAVETGG